MKMENKQPKHRDIDTATISRSPCAVVAVAVIDTSVRRRKGSLSLQSTLEEFEECHCTVVDALFPTVKD